MLLSDTSVKRPVFATVISLLLVAFGMLAFQQLQTREYPNISPAKISVAANYAGASASVMESQVTQILEDQISGVAGIKEIRSRSTDGRTSINIEFDLDVNIDAAANDVRDRVARTVSRLPDDVTDVRVIKSNTDASPVIYMSLESDSMNDMEIMDYAERYIFDRFAVIPGVSQIDNYGAGRMSMRVSLDRRALAARQLTVIDVVNALRKENLELPGGILESDTREFPVRISRNYQTEKDFNNLAISRGEQGHLVKLGEVAEVKIAPVTSRRFVISNGNPNSTAFAIAKQSTANTVDVLEGIKKEVELIRGSLPEGMRLVTSGDASAFIQSAISSVYLTMIVTVVLVGLVIYLFLFSARAMIIPMVAVPVCLIASFIGLALFDYSINLITLLALVLSIGLVVDDSIVVLENIYRRIEKGENPLLAAFNGSRQVSFAVVATTVVIVAVFMPLIFIQDNIGKIFSELAVAISTAVIISSVLALSLTPMLCSKLLKADQKPSRLASAFNSAFHSLNHYYVLWLNVFLRSSWNGLVVILFAVVALLFLVNNVAEEYAPQEVQDSFLAAASAPEGTSINRMREVLPNMHSVIDPYLESGDVTRTLMVAPNYITQKVNESFFAINMAPWGVRNVSPAELQKEFTTYWSKNYPDFRVFTFMRSGLSRSGAGLPVQFVIQGPSYEALAQWRDKLLLAARQSGFFGRINSDLLNTQQQLYIGIDTTRAAELGVSARSIGETLQTLLSERQVTSYSVDGEEYQVILQAGEGQITSPDDIQNIYVRSDRTGQLIPLSNVTTVSNESGISVLNRFNRLRSMTISANLAEGVVLGEALAFLEAKAQELLPQDAKIDYRGQSKEYKESSGSIYFTFGIALLVLFLVMAAQFESFVHPFVILFTVPLAITGAFFGLILTGTTLNIFSQIGMLMLIGIAAKNGILIVEFINQLRDAGRDFHEAIVEAAGIRLRPVIMTTISTLMGAIPLMLASGPGSEGRIVLGVVVFFGVAFSAFLTLFIIPSLYQLLAKNTGSPKQLEKQLNTLLEANK